MFSRIRKKIDEKFKISDRVWDLIETVLYCIAALILAYLIVTFVGQRTVVDGESMYNTLNDGDNIIVEKLSYTFGNPERFDIIVFPHYDSYRGEEVYYIKRIIGMPGDTLQIKNGLIYLIDEEGNKNILEEEYGYYRGGVLMQSGMASSPITIPEGYYFVLGDNRNNSKDSRDASVGLVKGEDIMGKAWLRFYPFSDFGFITHK